jgi:hypothetical protein
MSLAKVPASARNCATSRSGVMNIGYARASTPGSEPELANAGAQKGGGVGAGAGTTATAP